MMPKPKRCKSRECGQQFTPRRAIQPYCGYACEVRAATLAVEKRAAKAKTEDKRQTRAKKEAIKPRAQWLRECQAIINKIARMRDADDPCISCDRLASWGGQWHASHLRSVGSSPATRFHLWNIHKACSICNNHLSGNIAQYLPRVRAKIGNAKVDWLYAQNGRADHSVAYLKRFKAVMGRRLGRAMKKEQA